ncbi:putative sulfate exporter family transporter [Halobacillus rhizosphaerae]|uniref:YeiH family protein n=1 Tax=Halobacillus rhizosphaerae TaxID=3064889 RepID=UPI00398A67B0
MDVSLKSFHSKAVLTGIGFTALLAFLSFELAKLPGISNVGPLAVGILIAMVYRHFLGYPSTIHEGIQFSAKKLLRLAIILFGLKLDIHVIYQEGLPLLLKDIMVIPFSIGLMMLLARAFKADYSLSLLIGIGTGVCGASAIAAVSPILKVKEKDTALSVAIISVIGTIFAIGYTILRPLLPINIEAYGIWAGLSLHEIGHVALAGTPAGEAGLGMALLAKLGRVFLLVPLSLLLVWIMKKRSKESSTQQVVFPWFLLGFVAMSLFGSFVNGRLIQISANVLDGISTLTTFILTMAMVGLGLSVSVSDLRTRAFKPMVLLILTSLLLSLTTYLIL